jgi:DNA-binding response OmpR family regulator
LARQQAEFVLHPIRMPGARILTLSNNHELSSLRARVLEQCGYEVATPFGQAAAFMALINGRFDLMILCHTMQESFVKEVIQMLREANPKAGIIAMTETRWDLPKFNVDMTAAGSDGPDVLLKAVEDCLKNKKLEAA